MDVTMALTRFGCPVCSDATMKQYLLFLDKEHRFIIKDLDETHLLVDAAQADFIKRKMDELYEENTYVPIKTDL